MACLERLLIDHTRLSQTFYRPNSQDQQDRIQSAVRHHVDLIEAFQNRDAEGAVAITLEHWDLSRNRMEQFVRPDPLPIEYTGETL
jgi:DNA-binding GntR family transcriptional regulator